jgi:hypothetical protein
MATDIYHRAMAYDYGDDERAALMRKVWEPTPWIIEVYVGQHPYEGPRERQILEWCRDDFGDESSPIHGRAGRWHPGNATIYGWKWFGFATEADSASRPPGRHRRASRIPTQPHPRRPQGRLHFHSVLNAFTPHQRSST